MKKVIVFVGLLVFLLAAGCGGGQDAAPDTQPVHDEENQEDQADQGSIETPVESTISIRPPDGWVKQETSSSELLVHYLKDVASFIVTRGSLAESGDLENYINVIQQEQMVSAMFDNIVFGDVKNTTVDGYPAKEYDFSCEIAGIGFKYISVFLIKDGYSYNFLLGGFPEDFAQLENDFREFLNSVKFE